MRGGIWLLAATLLKAAPLAVAQVAPFLSDPFLNLTRPADFERMRASSYDQTGGNADARAVPPGGRLLLADLQGPGVIRHIWFTTGCRDPQYLRKVVLRMWWDEEESPSVESPLGDFFGLGWPPQVDIFSCAPFAIGRALGMNCWFPMPFRRRARIEVENQASEEMVIYFYIDYERHRSLPGDVLYFHAKWRCEYPATPGKDYLILEAKGEGQYVGCFLFVRLNRGGWFGEGDDKIWIDGEEQPRLWGTGTEDYFCGAWGFGGTFTTPFFGVPHMKEGFERGGEWTMYRFHILDPIPFKRSIRVAIEHWHGGRPLNQSGNCYASVAYWYQTEPHLDFSPLLPPENRLWPPVPPPFRIEGAIEGEELVGEAIAEGGEVHIQKLGEPWSGEAQLFFTPREPGSWVEISFKVEKGGKYRLSAYFTKSYDYGVIEAYLDGRKVAGPIDLFSPRVEYGGKTELGTFNLDAGEHRLRLVVVGKNESSKGFFVGMDCIVLQPEPG